MDALTRPPAPRNEPVRSYAPGSPERASLQEALVEVGGVHHELTVTIDGRQHVPGGAPFDVVAPHDHARVLGTGANATREDAKAGVEAALRAAPDWRGLPFDERAAVLLRAADLLSGPWRDRMNAATMLGQSKTCYQAEIDSACELADFWRFNVAFARGLHEIQPESSPGVWNRTDYRPLEGFVYAITPFNFTAIAGNLPTAPALMGNTVVWKPAPTPRRRSRRPRTPRRAGRRCRSTSAARSCSRPLTCSRARGASGSTPPRCWASPRRRTRPRSTAPAS